MLIDEGQLQPYTYLHPCPRCGKETMKEVARNRFHCFWCGFDRGLDRVDGGASAVLIIVGAIFLLLLLLQLT